MAKRWCLLAIEKLHVSAYSGHHQVPTSPLGLGILYKTLLARKLSKPEDGRYRSKYVVTSIANKHHHLAIYL